MNMQEEKKFSNLLIKENFRSGLYKQYILQEEVKIKHLQLELLFQSTSHSKKDKLALVSYDSDTCPFSYKTYEQVKMIISEILCQVLQISSQLIFHLPG